MSHEFNRSWANVNLDHISHNFNALKKLTKPNTKMMGVVKADAYGHGAVQVSKTLIENGVSYLAVATLEEALQLRNHFEVPILLLNHINPLNVEIVIENNITQTVYSVDFAKALSASAVKLNKIATIHIKIDTGMNRIGFCNDENVLSNIIEISKMPNINIEGLFTHFSCADENDPTYTEYQFEAFMKLINKLENTNIKIPLKHCANSATIIQYPKMHLDMVRPGISLYGLYPSSDIDRNAIELREAMSLRTTVTLVKEVPPKTKVSYGGFFETTKPTKLASLPIGYADGFSRILTNKCNTLINGEFTKIVGRICMDQCLIDITDIKDTINVGDEVVLFGSQGSNCISIDQVATQLGTINYEVVCMVGKRITRHYYKNNEIIASYSYI